ncbi:MAG TPA: serine/threonine-protein kinase [Thermoanaerobaculia bacterium]|jgi:serine/threonine protein kinase|nr:serine/threonine-protein kinase [Thermoanaerobaculia bacterium]
MNAKSREERTVGPYRLVEKIGEGGQGTVWRGFRGEGGEAVAVKVLRLSHPKKRARFLQEINIHSALSAARAPNVMPLLDHAVDETADSGVHGYIVMPVAEVSLHDVIDTLRERLELSLELLTGIATGLDAAHKAGAVHRDLKPGNILFLNRSLRDPLISDFGICLLRETPSLERITEVGETVGAKYFMAPEQEHGGVSDVTFAADVYAAGKLLHFMLTGRYLMREHLDKALQPDEIEREPRLQIILDELLSRCIVEDPAERIQSGGELLELCQRLLTSFRNPSSNGGSNGGSLRKYYDSFTQAFAGEDRQASLIFDELQEGLRTSWLDLHARVESRHDAAPEAADAYVRSQAPPLAASLALARMDSSALFSNFKRLLEFTTDLSEGIAGYAAIAAIPQVEAGFLYMAASVFALHHQSWNTLEKLLTAKFKWVYQSARVHHSYGFNHPYFFHSNALQREADRHNDIFRSILTETHVVEVTRLEKEQLLDVYAQTDFLMSLRAAQIEGGEKTASRWADFGRFYGDRVTPLLERIHDDAEYATGVLRAFGESRDEFEMKLNARLDYIQLNFFSGEQYLYDSIREWTPR